MSEQHGSTIGPELIAAFIDNLGPVLGEWLGSRLGMDLCTALGRKVHLKLEK